MVCLLLAGLSLIDLYYYRKIEKSIYEQTSYSLEKENNDMTAYLNGIVQSKMEWLEMAASFCEVPDGSGAENWWAQTEEFQTEHSRFGIAGTDGILYYGDHCEESVAGRDYYEAAMKGQSGVSGVLAKDYRGRDAVVLAVPMIRDGTVKGAACMEYSTMELGTYLNNAELNRSGANLVCDSEGRIVASFEGMQYFDTIFDMLETMEYKTDGEVERFREQIRSGESGCFVYYKNNSMRLLCYQPAGIEDWMSITLAVTDIYAKTFGNIRAYSLKLVVSTVLVVTAIAFIITWIIRIRNKEIQKTRMDVLTGVYTREAGRKIVERDFMRRQGRKYSACVFLDIDNFKHINDTYGHDKGDRVLEKIGSVLRGYVKEQEIASRYGGDEFCLWLVRKGGARELSQEAERLMRLAAEHQISVSLGIAAVRSGENSYDEIIKRADQAMYRAKQSGKNQFCIIE